MTESSPSDSSNISSSKSSSPSDASFFSDFCCPFTFSCLVFCLIKPPCKLSSSRTELMKVKTWPLQIDCKQLILSIFFNKFIHICCKCCFCTNIIIFEICCHICPNITKHTTNNSHEYLYLLNYYDDFIRMCYKQTQYVEPDLTRYDAIDAVINANELQERQQLDPLMQEMFDELA